MLVIVSLAHTHTISIKFCLQASLGSTVSACLFVTLHTLHGQNYNTGKTEQFFYKDNTIARQHGSNLYTFMVIVQVLRTFLDMEA